MDRSTLLKFGVFFIVITFLSGLTLIQIGEEQYSLNFIPGQLDKVVGASDLHYNLRVQSYYIEGFMLYQDEAYLEMFRHYGRINQEQLQLLHGEVRQSRKPLVERIISLQHDYTQKCEDEIVPLVQRGDIAGAALITRSGRVESLLEEMVSLNEELKMMRLEDTRRMASLISSQAGRSLLLGICFFILLILVTLIIRDIAERKLVEERLRGMAVRDSMTMLYNHSFLKQNLEQEIKLASARGDRLAFMILDLDDFKSYNDILGHPAGDELLKTVAGLLEKNIRGSDTLGRYGGDEFAVILPGADHATAMEVGERLRRAVAEYPFHYRELMPAGRVTVSAGVACFPDDATDAAKLLVMSDEAMYNAKRNAKNMVEVYFSAFKELQHDWPHEQDVLYNIKGLLAMVNSKDRYTYGHSEKVAQYATALARSAGLSEKEVKEIKVAAFLHDIGKVDIPEEILNKPGPLSREELKLIQRHTVTGAGIVGQIKSLDDIVQAILYHHERYDGKGYPHGLAAEEIPLAARIISLADSFDAMTSHRPYRRAMTVSEAVDEIKREAGRQFDPYLAELLLRLGLGSVLAAAAATEPDQSLKS